MASLANAGASLLSPPSRAERGHRTLWYTMAAPCRPSPSVAVRVATIPRTKGQRLLGAIASPSTGRRVRLTCQAQGGRGKDWRKRVSHTAGAFMNESDEVSYARQGHSSRNDKDGREEESFWTEIPRFEKAGPTPPPVTMKDIQRIALSSILLGLLTSFKIISEGRLGGLVDTIFDGIVQIWFIFVAADFSLTAATWIVAKLTSSSTEATAACPWCEERFKFDREVARQHHLSVLLSGGRAKVAACPCCAQGIVYTGSEKEPIFVQSTNGGPSTSDQGFAKPSPFWAGGNVVDVEATVHDKE